MDIQQVTFYKNKFGNLRVTELRRLRQLEYENAKLKQLIADLSIDKHMLQDVIQIKPLSPAQLKQLGETLVTSHYKVFVYRACVVAKFCRSMWYYKKLDLDDQVIKIRTKEIAETLDR